MLRGSLRKLAGRRDSPPTTSLPGSNFVRASRYDRRRGASTIASLALGAVFLTIFLLLCVFFLTSNGDSLVGAANTAAPGTSPRRAEDVVKELQRDAGQRRGAATGMESPPPPRNSATPAVDDETKVLTGEKKDKPPGVNPTTAAAMEKNDLRTVRPGLYKGRGQNQTENGEYELEEPDRLPGLRLSRRTYTPAELLLEFGNTDFIYTFANGSEMHHAYRKEVRNACLAAILKREDALYDAAAADENMFGFKALGCTPAFLRSGNGAPQVVGELVHSMRQAASHGADNRDRETDELRHSIRSLEQHVQWHRGRVVIVSPGHHPTWVDGAKNFLAGVCGDAAVQALRTRGTHLRLTTVHQDAIMPYGMRFTADSHVIEQHMWRVRNTTAVHVYMNDDYFVNRDVAITDLFNEYGGTIVRVGAGILKEGEFPSAGGSWKGGVLHTQQFNIQELDVKHEDDLPRDLIEMWEKLGRIKTSSNAPAQLPQLPAPSLDEAIDVAHHYAPEPLTKEPLSPRRARHYASHAPFAYCTNMFRFFETRYEREFALKALRHRSRKAADLFVPFLYNAFIMARPWQASPNFLPYLLQLHRSQQQTPTEAPPSVEIALDNFDGCAPATLLAGAIAGQCVFAKFLDDLKYNDDVMRRVATNNPLYFNINAGFSSAEASDQLRKFLHDKFPTPVYLEEAPPTTTVDPQEAEPGEEEEKAAAPVAKADPALTSTFNALMQLPVVGVVSYEEGACPLVRSLSLAFAGHHRGRVHVAVQRHGDGAADETLREARTRLSHRIVSAMSGVKCTFNARVTSAPAMRAETVADVARRVLQTSDGAGVELPSTCGGGGGGSGGLRVRGFVIDARTPHAPVQSDAALREALAMPGQTLALEDFRAARVGPEERDVVLVLAREDAVAKAVHWITGASENDLFVTYPVPMAQYENLAVPIKWSEA